MQQLYDFAKSIGQPLQNPPAECRSVSITYAGRTNKSKWEATEWFVRDPDAQLVKAPEAAQAIKRTQNGPQDTSKKKKVRLGKKMDVGSLLGTFG
jgi:hypothetical protein